MAKYTWFILGWFEDSSWREIMDLVGQQLFWPSAVSLLHFFLFVVFNPMLYVTRKRHMTSLALKWSNGYKFPDCYSLINISIKWFTQKVEKEISLHPLRKLMYETGLPCCLILAFYIKGKLASVNSFMSAHVCFTEHNFLLTSYGDQFLSNKNVRAEGLPWRSSG